MILNGPMFYVWVPVLGVSSVLSCIKSLILSPLKSRWFGAMIFNLERFVRCRIVFLIFSLGLSWDPLMYCMLWPFGALPCVSSEAWESSGSFLQ